MAVVTDASPIILLSRLGFLDLLPVLFDRVLVPEAVRHEVIVKGRDLPGARELEAAAWAERVAHDADAPMARSLSGILGPGECAAICIASQRRAERVLLDERQGRLVAMRLGLAVKGTVGVLVLARRRDLVPELRPLLARLDAEGARLGPALIDAALRAVGEAPQ